MVPEPLVLVVDNESGIRRLVVEVIAASISRADDFKPVGTRSGVGDD